MTVRSAISRESGSVVLYFVLFLLIVSALTAAYQRLVLPTMTVGVASRTLIVRQACLDSARAAVEASCRNENKSDKKKGDEWSGCQKLETDHLSVDGVNTLSVDGANTLPCGQFKIESASVRDNKTSVTVSFDLMGSTIKRTFLIPKE